MAELINYAKVAFWHLHKLWEYPTSISAIIGET